MRRDHERRSPGNRSCTGDSPRRAQQTAGAEHGVRHPPAHWATREPGSRHIGGGVAARRCAGLAIPRLGHMREPGGGDGVPALLAAAKSAVRQAGERLFYVGERPAGGDRAPKHVPQHPFGGTVAGLVGASRGGVMVGQRQLRDLAQPRLPSRLEEGSPVRQGSGCWARLDEMLQLGGRIRLPGGVETRGRCRIRPDRAGRGGCGGSGAAAGPSAALGRAWIT